eukprot:m.73140 g.73140  ORF g.73140 m.73140 type:complete len:102 (+) comp20320_c0_seq1:113-418(+)
MNRIKVVLGERERALQEAYAKDAEKVDALRAAQGLPPLKPEPEPKPEQSPGTYRQLLGVERPGKARPGQLQRPMTRREKRKFREELAKRRLEVQQAGENSE